MPGTGLDVKRIVRHNAPISAFYDPVTASSEFGYLWGSPD